MYTISRLDHGVLPSESEDKEDEDNIHESEQEVELGPNITRLRTNEDIGTLLQVHPVFVNTKQLMELARTTVSLNCKVKGCGGIVQMSMQTVSSATYLKWVSMILCSMEFHLSLSNNIESLKNLKNVPF